MWEKILREPLIYGASQVLLPVIPAFILFKALPSRAAVAGRKKGLLKGLHLKLSGAFAGYFVLFLVVVETWPAISPPVTPPYQLWRVNGSLKIVNLDGSQPPEGYAKYAVTFSQTPPTSAWDPNGGNFTVDVLVRPGLAPGVQDFPTLGARVEGYSPAAVWLGPRKTLGQNYTIHINNEKHEIQIDEPLVLRKLSDQ